MKSNGTTVAGSRAVPLTTIQADEGSQGRVKINASVVHRYAEAMTQQLEEGALRFPPVVLFSEGQNYWLGDGFHRVLAARRVGLDEILAEVHSGTQRDALLFSLSSNSAHGLPRSNADKKKAVLLLLGDLEWSQWSDREIARRCCVSHPFVTKLRKRASGNGFQMRQRKVRRGANVYEMETATIGTAGGQTRAGGSSGAEVAELQGELLATDLLGIPLSGRMPAVFASLADFQEAKRLHAQLSGLIDRIARAAGGEVLCQQLKRKSESGTERFACADLELALRKLVTAEPFCSYCPYCHLAHAGWGHPDCQACQGRGWTTRAAFEACPENYRKEILRMQKARL